MNIPKKKLIDWYEALSYAFNDVDLVYEDDEARESVRSVWIELSDFLREKGIDLTAEMKKRGALAESMYDY